MRATSGNNGAGQKLYVTPNTTYTLTAWGKKGSTLANLMIFVKNYGGTEIQRYFTSTSYTQKSITFTPTVTSCTIGVWAWNGSGYGYADDFVLTNAAQNVWIAIRTDGLPGTGTQTDPYDGSTPGKFDQILYNYYWTYNLRVHLGPGTFRTYANHLWAIRPGWVLSGEGMYSTRIQMVGSLAGMHYVYCISSDPDISTDNVAIRDLTCDSNWAGLSTTADTGAGGEKNISTNAIQIWGSNNVVERVRSINTYGSWANLKEHFGIALTGPSSGDGTNNVIQFCRAELPQGNYGSPFALAGWTSSIARHLMTNSKVISCTAVGANNGLATGFTSGGANLCNVKDCLVEDNTFTDCFGAAYIDTGSVDGLKVTNNTVTRGWMGVGLRSRVFPKQNIQITENNFLIQNRVPGGASVGIVVGDGTTTNVTIDRNTIRFDTSGRGMKQFWCLVADLLNTATVSNNTIEIPNYPNANQANGVGVTRYNNRTPAGALIPGLN